MTDFAQQRQRYRLGRWRGEMAPQWTDAEGAPIARAAMTCMDPTSNVVVHVGSGGTTHTSGLMRCGNVGLCPVCAPVIRQKRSADIDAAHEAHQLTGGSSYFATFTVPHDRHESPAVVLDRLRSMWRSMQQASGFRSWRADAGVEGMIRAFEVTYGDNGWHWHLHVLFFVRGKVDVARLARCWERQFRSNGLGDRYVPRVSFDCRKLSRKGIGSYLGKLSHTWGAGAELARADRKRRSIGPAQLLELAHDEWQNMTLTGDITYQHLWHQLEAAAKGLRWIEWSPGLRAKAGAWQLDAIVAGHHLCADLLTVEEATDEEAARGEDADDVVASWHVPAGVWRKFRRAGELGLLLAALVSNDGHRYGCWLVTPHRGDPYSVSAGSSGQLVMVT